MANKKQTAVDFLIEQILLTNPKVYKLMIESNSFEQAKQMEKQQIIKAWVVLETPSQIEMAEEYYEKTYE
jgi:hypothetical protein